MNNREKLIKGLQCHLRIDGLQCKDCPYWKNIRNTCICEKEIEVDALELLKEQEEQLAMMRMIYGTDAKIVGEIVRCKDCKKQGSYDCHITSLTGQTSSDDWFCADGVKRDE